MLRILAVSDQVVEQLYSPAITERFRDVDLVIGCGDLPHYYLEYIASMLNVPILSVPGNHDLPLPGGEGGAALLGPDGTLGSGLPGNIDGRVLREGSLLLAGLGGSLRYRPDGIHQYSQAQMAWRILRLVPRLWGNRFRHGRYLDILVTHSPPQGVHDGADPAHVGFRAFHSLIARFRPRYLLHGHSHVYRRDTVTVTQVGPTTVVNVCPFRVVTLEDDRG
jgi:Icc-related predicted phosphoesterase